MHITGISIPKTRIYTSRVYTCKRVYIRVMYICVNVYDSYVN